MYYYKSRIEAGRKLASKLEAYRQKRTSVVALSESSVIVGQQIAAYLHASLMLYMIRNIALPGEDRTIAAISSTGSFRYNDTLSSGEVTEISTEFRNFIEQEKFGKVHEMNMLLGGAGEIDKNRLRHHNVILVADGLPDGFSLTMVYEYLKTVATARIIVAVPVAGVDAVDRMHLVADELHVGGVTENFLSIDHYYDDNNIPDFDGVMQIMEDISLAWAPKQKAHPAGRRHLGRYGRSNVLRRPV